MTKIKKYKENVFSFAKNAALLLVLLQFIFGNALAGTFDEDGSIFFSSGKVYVVVGVISIIFIGLVIFLILTERRVKKLEDAMKQAKNIGDRDVKI